MFPDTLNTPGIKRKDKVASRKDQTWGNQGFSGWLEVAARPAVTAPAPADVPGSEERSMQKRCSLADPAAAKQVDSPVLTSDYSRTDILTLFKRENNILLNFRSIFCTKCK